MNLIINASEAIGERDGTIRVATSLSSGGDAVRLEVSDTGRRMPEDQQAKVFDPFFSTKFAGRGLGLRCPRHRARAWRIDRAHELAGPRDYI